MLSNLKRYRSQVSLVQKACLNHIKETQGGFGIANDCLLSRAFNTNFKGQMYGVTLEVEVTIDGTKLRAVEDSGLVYIGVDLLQKPEVEIPTGRYQGDFDLFIWDKFYYFLNCADTGSKIEIDIVNSGYSVRDVLNDQNLFYKTDVYKNIKTIADSVLTDYQYSASLKDKEWPRLSDRSILPVAVLDFDKNQVTFIRNTRATGYRRDVDTYPIDIFASKGENAFRYMRVPRWLYGGEYTNKYVGRVRF